MASVSHAHAFGVPTGEPAVSTVSSPDSGIAAARRLCIQRGPAAVPGHGGPRSALTARKRRSSFAFFAKSALFDPPRAGILTIYMAITYIEFQPVPFRPFFCRAPIEVTGIVANVPVSFHTPFITGRLVRPDPPTTNAPAVTVPAFSSWGWSGNGERRRCRPSNLAARVGPRSTAHHHPFYRFWRRIECVQCIGRIPSDSKGRGFALSELPE